MGKDLLDEVRYRLSRITPEAFEHLCCDLLRTVYPQEYGEIEPSFNALGKTTRGTPDAFVSLEDGRYIVFQFTTQQSNLKRKILDDIRKLATNSHFPAGQSHLNKPCT